MICRYVYIKYNWVSVLTDCVYTRIWICNWHTYSNRIFCHSEVSIKQIFKNAITASSMYRVTSKQNLKKTFWTNWSAAVSTARTLKRPVLWRIRPPLCKKAVCPCNWGPCLNMPTYKDYLVHNYISETPWFLGNNIVKVQKCQNSAVQIPVQLLPGAPQWKMGLSQTAILVSKRTPFLVIT